MTSLDDQTRTLRGGIEIPARRPARWAELAKDFGAAYLGSGVTAVLFSATGPVAVIMAAGTAGSLTGPQIASWIFGVFVLNGLLTCVASWVYRMPLAFFWTIPGTVIVGQALPTSRWSDVVGAYIVTGVLIAVLGATGAVKTVMSAVPHRLVMALVAGAFLSFGTELVRSVSSDAVVAGSMVIAWLAATRFRVGGRQFPPIFAALCVGLVAPLVTGWSPSTPAGSDGFSPVGLPSLVSPTWNAETCLQLVLPLAITVIAVQNAQGTAVLTASGHRPPLTMITLFSGFWSVLAAFVGAVSSCLAGPSNALLVADGERRRQYVAGIVCGVVAVVVGVFAPALVWGLSVVPHTFVAALAGVAMLDALRGAFAAAFSPSREDAGKARPPFGPLVTFVVTVSGIQIAGLSAPVWGLGAGILAAWLLDREPARA
ncbi:benzoate/H(+) symporter BenE family transporter [Rhodococcus sp. BP-252]|uniref:benzoate/H(+) symporter BenE family transporter n=1 Tax=unclassified Rhodococcus (in: high G+C Gram-positive bacteria) TaxID=192944 RepID=UPI001C9B8529|nr:MULTISPECIES: benzoate/H(+) symporter BenE family transporter [unclassified Rhodococcus (in: high G+C Gram-positive bacteria)]MBY6412807.1 benzoate/H(+) symporter BenE family transporter [Rhodococcus sp. BP-320]MBY6417656.1 benzoate/H(+) symporter BenE family transporter [Rhodococcus sp. BP-321]MBY6423508.1 benzoate/H(+) symporter BenE family transporter [Rhodococcus sp. BP-324]MBY6427680.1 benzoate/H(+) symporter BenE family transporter [Rhodococcus sp. BP-323]MBY6432844.1 benzoate/H(+) sy